MLTKPIIGVDFDNTIVSYSHVFYEAAVEQQLIDENFPKNKEKIRDHLRARGQEDDWTALQGYVYGKKMGSAKPFPGVIDFFKTVLANEIDIYIISHRSRYPYAGPQYDLHQAAYEWLEQQQFFSPAHLGLKKDQVFFIETKLSKCQTIQAKQCTHFIDDLPELLLDNAFPGSIHKLLFAPEKQNNTADALLPFTSWTAIHQYFNEFFR